MKLTESEVREVIRNELIVNYYFGPLNESVKTLGLGAIYNELKKYGMKGLSRAVGKYKVAKYAHKGHHLLPAAAKGDKWKAFREGLKFNPKEPKHAAMMTKVNSEMAAWAAKHNYIYGAADKLLMFAVTPFVWWQMVEAIIQEIPGAWQWMLKDPGSGMPPKMKYALNPSYASAISAANIEGFSGDGVITIGAYEQKRSDDVPADTSGMTVASWSKAVTDLARWSDWFEGLEIDTQWIPGNDEYNVNALENLVSALRTPNACVFELSKLTGLSLNQGAMYQKDIDDIIARWDQGKFTEYMSIFPWSRNNAPGERTGLDLQYWDAMKNLVKAFDGTPGSVGMPYFFVNIAGKSSVPIQNSNLIGEADSLSSELDANEQNIIKLADAYYQDPDFDEGEDEDEEGTASVKSDVEENLKLIAQGVGYGYTIDDDGNILQGEDFGAKLANFITKRISCDVTIWSLNMIKWKNELQGAPTDSQAEKMFVTNSGGVCAIVGTDLMSQELEGASPGAAWAEWESMLAAISDALTTKDRTEQIEKIGKAQDHAENLRISFPAGTLASRIIVIWNAVQNSFIGPSKDYGCTPTKHEFTL